VIADYKTELVLLMDQRTQSRRKEQAEADRLRRIEYEALTTNLNRLEKELQVLPRYADDLKARRAESQRLGEVVQRMNESMIGMNKRNEDRGQTVTYLEERRRVDGRRIDELQGESIELRRKMDGLVKRLPLLEESIQKQKPLIEKAVQEVRKYEKPIEELRIADFQREQKMRQYLEQGELVAQELERIRQQTAGFLEQQQSVKRGLDKLGLFQERIDTRQNEMGQRQRLAEEHMRTQREEWEARQTKELKKRDVVTQQRWDQQKRTNDDLAKHDAVFSTMLKMHHNQLETLWEVRRADATALLKSSQDLYDTYIAPTEEQLAILRAGRGE